MPAAPQHSAMDRTGTGSTRSIFWQIHVLIIERAIIGSLPSFVHCYNVEVLHAGVAELVDAPDSKSGGAKAPCRFEPDLRYCKSPLNKPLLIQTEESPGIKSRGFGSSGLR